MKIENLKIAMAPFHHYAGLVKVTSARTKGFWCYEGKTDFMVFVKPLSAKLTKWSNTLK